MEALLKIMVPIGFKIFLPESPSEIIVSSLLSEKNGLFDYVDFDSVKKLNLPEKTRLQSYPKPIIPFLTIKQTTNEEVLDAISISKEVSMLTKEQILMTLDLERRDEQKILIQGHGHKFLFSDPASEKIMYISIQNDSPGFEGVQFRTNTFPKLPAWIGEDTIFYFFVDEK